MHGTSRIAKILARASGSSEGISAEDGDECYKVGEEVGGLDERGKRRGGNGVLGMAQIRHPTSPSSIRSGGEEIKRFPLHE